MMKIRSLLIGGAVGAMAAYFLDPELGGGRRARLQEQVLETVRQGRRTLDRAGQQFQYRVSHLELTPPFERDDDLVVLSRVESVLASLPGVPRGSIESEVVDGRLVLRGRAASDEHARVIAAATSSVRGVAGVESQLLVASGEAPARRDR